MSTNELALSVYKPRNTFMAKSNTTIANTPIVNTINDSVALLGIMRS